MRLFSQKIVGLVMSAMGFTEYNQPLIKRGIPASPAQGKWNRW